MPTLFLQCFVSVGWEGRTSGHDPACYYGRPIGQAIIFRSSGFFFLSSFCLAIFLISQPSQLDWMSTYFQTWCKRI